ncbi:O-linked N-acetylglucosamine transferase, SPINDLY family protein [Cupriavidus necator]
MPRHIPAAAPPQRLLEKARAEYQAHDYAGALRTLAHAERLGVRSGDMHFMKAASLLKTGCADEAYPAAELAMKLYPRHPRVLALMGAIEVQRVQYKRAAEVLKRSLDLDPKGDGVWQEYASVLYRLADYEGSRQAGARALQLTPNDPAALGNYASALRETGESLEAIPYFRKACAIEPRHRHNRTNLLFACLYDHRIGAGQVKAETQAWAETLASQAVAAPASWPARPGRVRLGIFSNDLRLHACAYFLIPLIANLDRSRFEVVLVSLNPSQDHVTEKIRQYADQFLDVSRNSEAEVVALVRNAGLDALVDLGGYAGASPLTYMVHQLAPVQLTWLGYPGTTGMKQIGYRVTDSIGDPEGCEGNYTETLLRAPVFCAYHPLVTNPLGIYAQRYRVRETPALANGYVTFGSCNGMAKLTKPTLDLWSAVLANCPGSRLLIEASGLDQPSLRERMEQRLRAHGIDTSRVELVARSSANQYLTYHRIDIALDTTPVTGGTTTCDSLWMGVPVVSLAGGMFHQRVSAPFLHATGLDELICDTPQRYVEVACALADDVEQLNALRLSLRQRAEQSAMCDAAGFAAWLEERLGELVAPAKPVPPRELSPAQGVYFGGTWHGYNDIVLSVAAHLHQREYTPLRNLLENLTSSWYRHWMVAYALAITEYESGDKAYAIELLVEGIGMRPYALPLYRLLAHWLDEGKLDKSSLAQLLHEQFGLMLETLEASPVPSVFEILGIEVKTQAAAAPEAAEVPV